MHRSLETKHETIICTITLSIFAWLDSNVLNFLSTFLVTTMGHSKERQDDDGVDDTGAQQGQTVAEFDNNLYRRLGSR